MDLQHPAGDTVHGSPDHGHRVGVYGVVVDHHDVAVIRPCDHAQGRWFRYVCNLDDLTFGHSTNLLAVDDWVIFATWFAAAGFAIVSTIRTLVFNFHHSSCV